MNDLQLSIVIPTWNQIKYTTACVTSVRRHTDVDYELIIVDNGSEPEQASAAQRLADEFVANETNLGFAAAMNQGLKLATGAYVAFVNNDTVFPERWASPLLETAAAQHDLGLVLPAVTAAGNQSSVRSEPADRVTAFPPFAAIPSGVVYVASRQTMLDVGGWNERYGVASAEDLDLLFTFWANGRSVVLDERVLVHHESAISASVLPDRNKLYKANRLAFASRWASVDPKDVPRLPSLSDQDFATNLEKARIAGTWMQQWFRTKDLADDRARQVRAAQAQLGATTEAPSRGAVAGLWRRLRGG